MMPADQEKLFARALKGMWRGWETRTVSGYVKGVVDGLREIPPDYRESSNAYAFGYILGYADAYGSDVIRLYGFEFIEARYRWWENNDDSS